jgi:hypothetical protein
MASDLYRRWMIRLQLLIAARPTRLPPRSSSSAAAG